MEYKNDWEQAKKRLIAFWNRELIDRCCISVMAPTSKSTAIQEVLPDSQKDKIRYWTDGEWIVKRNRKLFESTYFGGEAFPQIWLNLGAAGHAGYFKGARYKFEETVWFLPIISDYKTDILEFDPDGFLYRKTAELARYFVNESGGDYFISMPDTSGNLDALAHLRGNVDLLTDLLDEKDHIREALSQIQKVWVKTNEDVYGIVSAANQGGSTVGWMNTWAPGRHAQMQADISVMLSPLCFEEFILPELKEQSKWMDYSIYHFDGMEQIRHLDMLLAIPELSAIQWTNVVGQPSPVAFIPELKKIQAAGKSLVVFLEPNDVEPILENLSSRGLYLNTKAESEEAARDIIKKVEKLSHE